MGKCLTDMGTPDRVWLVWINANKVKLLCVYQLWKEVKPKEKLSL